MFVIILKHYDSSTNLYIYLFTHVNIYKFIYLFTYISFMYITYTYVCIYKFLYIYV